MAREVTVLPPKIEMPDGAWKRALATKLLAWYRKHKRDLPWRESGDPYRVWVSEIMLQQTQVATVGPYFARFVATFPTIAALAAADEHEVLRLWEGLGYYRRARQLHRTAQIIAGEHGGDFPRDLAAIRRLPGIGRYTAGAILSIAFDQPAAILEANTVRLLSRLAGFTDDPNTTAGLKALWALSEALVPKRRCGDFNQALMELGSEVCSPKRPTCRLCPLTGECSAFRDGTQDTIPRPAAKPRVEAVREAAVVVWQKNKVFVRRCVAGQRWGGLWDFLRFPIESEEPKALAKELASKVREQAGLEIARPARIATIKHSVTRFRITLDCYRAECRAARSTLPAGQWQWLEPSGLAELPLSVTGRKLSEMLKPGRAKK